MKKSNLLLNLLLAFVLIGGMVACNDDEPGLEEKEGINVAAGYYLAVVGEDPVPGALLSPANVDGPSIGSLERPGFVQGYMYLEAGDYNLVEVEDKQIAETRGGTLTTVTGADANNDECGGEAETEYHVVAGSTVDGAAFTVSTAGFYVVAYDGFASGTNDIVLDQIESVGLIGDATPGGWGEDTPMTFTTNPNADGFEAEAVDVTLDEAQMKFRFNCRWAIDRRADIGQDFANDNGYSFWTNFGGTLSGTDVTLVPGNDAGNIQIGKYAEYKVTFAWDAIEGFSATVTETGEAEPKPEYPEMMYLVGAGTAYGWTGPGDAANNGNDEMHKVAGGAENEGLFWKILHLEANQGFKISAAGWSQPNIDCGNIDEVDAEGVAIICSGNDWTVAESKMYMVVLDLRGDMTKVSIKPAEVYGMGSAFGSWDEKTYTCVVDDVAKTITSPAVVSTDNVRTYVFHSWIPAWWQAEFVPESGAITYRNDSSDDPPAVALTVGDKIVYTFDNNTSAITQ